MAWWGYERQAPNKLTCAQFTEEDVLTITYWSAQDYKYVLKAQLDYKKRQVFTPTITLEQKYLDYKDYSSGTITCGKSALGTGKTHDFQEWESRHEYASDERLIILTSRRNLNKGLVNRIQGVENILDIDAPYVDLDETQKVALCVDSILKLRNWENTKIILFLDEIVALLRHLYTANTDVKTKRLEKINTVKYLVRKADRIIALDGNNKDWVVEWLKNASSNNKEIIVFENTYTKKFSKPVTFCEGDYDISVGGRVFFRTFRRDPLVRCIIDKLKAGKNIAIYADNQKELEQLHLWLKEECQLETQDILRVDGKTSNCSSEQNFLNHPDDYIKARLPRLLLYSPSMGEGIDVSIKGYFDAQFGFLFGVAGVGTIDMLHQMQGRIRDVNTERFIWVNVRGLMTPSLNEIHSPFSEEVLYQKRQEIRNWAEICAEGDLDLQSRVFERENYLIDDNVTTAIEMIAEGNYERSNLRNLIRQRIKATGNEVVILRGNHTLIQKTKFVPLLGKEVCYLERDPADSGMPENEELKEQRQHYKKQQHLIDATSIFEAPEPVFNDRTDCWEAVINNSFSENNWAQRAKAYIYNRLPNIQNSVFWSATFINKFKNLHPYCISALTNYLYLRYFEECKTINRASLLRFLGFNEKPVTPCLWDYKLTIGVLNGIKKSGLLDILPSSLFDTDDFSYHQIYTNNSPKLLEIINKCKTIRALPKVGKQTPIQYLNKLLIKIGFELTTSDKGGERHYNLQHLYYQKEGEEQTQLLEDELKDIISSLSQKLTIKAKTEETNTAKMLEVLSKIRENRQQLSPTEESAEPLTGKDKKPHTSLNKSLYNITQGCESDCTSPPRQVVPQTTAKSNILRVGSNVTVFPNPANQSILFSGVVTSIEGNNYQVLLEGKTIPYPFLKENLVLKDRTA